jgi:hypothetical protein
VAKISYSATMVLIPEFFFFQFIVFSVHRNYLFVFHIRNFTHFAVAPIRFSDQGSSVTHLYRSYFLSVLLWSHDILTPCQFVTEPRLSGGSKGV